MKGRDSSTLYPGKSQPYSGKKNYSGKQNQLLPLTYINFVVHDLYIGFMYAVVGQHMTFFISLLVESLFHRPFQQAVRFIHLGHLVTSILSRRLRL